jgi:hypothetical protein
VARLRLYFTTVVYGLAQYPRVFPGAQNTGPDRSQSELSHQESLAKGSLVCYGLLWVEKFPLFVYLEPLSATGSFTTCHVSRIFLASQGPQFVTRDKVWLNLWVPTKWVTEVDRTLSRLHAEVYMRSQTNIPAGFIASIHVQEFTSLLG